MICLLEGSGKWPDEKKAFNRLMAAFHIQLAESIKTQYGFPVSVYPRHIDVVKVTSILYEPIRDILRNKIPNKL